MKLRHAVATFISFFCSLMMACSPMSVLAEGEQSVPDSPPVTPTPSLIISEVQTGAGISGHAGDEFIELHNTTGQPLDVSGWQLRYVSSTATTASIDNPSFRADIEPPQADGVPVLLAAQGQYVLRTSTLDIPGQAYSGNLTASGSLVLFAPVDVQTCQRTAVDAVAWGSGALGDGTPVTTDGKDKLIVRLTNADGYSMTGENFFDFAGLDPKTSGLATPGLPNTQAVADGALLPPAPAARTSGMQITENTCSLPEPSDPPADSPPSVTEPPVGDPVAEDTGDVGDTNPTIPLGNIGLRPPQISELLPNPAPPQTDADDEFIELYNPNDQIFDLSGYVLESGLTSKRRYTMPEGLIIQPHAFLAFFSADTKLTLSNTGGQVDLADPLGNILLQSDPYSAAKDGQAWLLANGSWQWTTRPTPNAINVVSAPAVKTASTTKPAKKPTARTAAAKKPSSAASKNQSPQQDIQTAATVAATPAAPLHPGVLALIAVSALLYGAYEYRRDVANKFYQLRSNRAARREDRQSAKGR